MNDSLKWIKARASGGSGGNCVEVASGAGHVYTRDTKRREAGHLTVTAAKWRAFVAGVRAGDFDLDEL